MILNRAPSTPESWSPPRAPAKIEPRERVQYEAPEDLSGRMPPSRQNGLRGRVREQRRFGHVRPLKFAVDDSRPLASLILSCECRATSAGLEPRSNMCPHRAERSPCDLLVNADALAEVDGRPGQSLSLPACSSTTSANSWSQRSSLRLPGHSTKPKPSDRFRLRLRVRA